MATEAEVEAVALAIANSIRSIYGLQRIFKMSSDDPLADTMRIHAHAAIRAFEDSRLIPAPAPEVADERR